MKKRLLKIRTISYTGLIHRFILLLLIVVPAWALNPAKAACTTYCTVGPAGDYVTDGIDDQVQINAALADVAALSSYSVQGTVHIKAGTYNLKNQIFLKSFVTLEGEGMSRTALKIVTGIPDIDNSGIINIASSVTGSKLQNFTLDGNYNNVGGISDWDRDNWMGVAIFGSNVIVKYVKFIRMSNDGIHIFRTAAGYGNYENLWMDTLRHSCIMWNEAQNHKAAVYNLTCIDNSNSGLRIDKSSNVFANHINISHIHNAAVEMRKTGTVADGTEDMHNITIENLTSWGADSSAPGVVNGIYIAALDHPYKPSDPWRASDMIFRNIILDLSYFDSPAYYLTGPGSTWRSPGGGILVRNANNITFENVITRRTKGSGISVMVDSAQQSNTISRVNVKNSIFSDINMNVFSGTGNVLWNISYNNWYNVSGNRTGNVTFGMNNTMYNPHYANPTTVTSAMGDYHLKSVFGRCTAWTIISCTNWTNDTITSPLIDAGDPANAYSNEQKPNGWRIDIGAYGNTISSSKSPATSEPTKTFVVTPASPITNLTSKSAVTPTPVPPSTPAITPVTPISTTPVPPSTPVITPATTITPAPHPSDDNTDSGDDDSGISDSDNSGSGNSHSDSDGSNNDSGSDDSNNDSDSDDSNVLRLE